MNQLSPEALKILNAGRDALSPSDAAKEQVFQSLQASLSNPAMLPKTGVLGGVSALKLISLVALMAGIGGGWWAYSSGNSKDTPQLAVTSVQEPIAKAATVATKLNSRTTTPQQQAPENQLEESQAALAETELETKLPNPESIKKTREPSQRAKHKRAKPATQSSLLAEQKLIAAAQRAIANGNYKRATAMLAKHKAQFPKGILTPERKGAQAIALCKGENQSAGVSLARSFLRENGTSPLAQPVKRSCGLP